MPGYERTAYMDFLLQNREREVVSVLTGMRGAGKTSLLAQYVSRLQAEGVPENRIFFADMSDPEARRFFPEEKLFREIMRRFAGRKKAWVILDEAQELPGFERLADRLFRIPDLEICLAGSGLAAELPKLEKALPGRCAVKTVYPLSFREVLSAEEDRPADAEALLRYAEKSAMPEAAALADPRLRLDGIVSAALYHEVIGDPAVRPQLLEKLLRLLSRRAGSLLTEKELCRDAGRAGRPLLTKTLRAVLARLADAGLLLALPLVPLDEPEPASPPDTFRFFFPDPAMTRVWGRDEAASFLPLMNAAAVEFLRRGLSLRTGMTAAGPVDFVAGNGALRTLWQFIPDGNAPEAEEKKNALAAAPEAYRKCALTFTPEAFPKESGVRPVPLVPWFLGKAPYLL